MQTKQLLKTLSITFLSVLLLMSCHLGNNNSNDTEKVEGFQSEVLKTFKISDVVIPEGNKPIECRSMRLRRFVLTPGGEIGLHSHENRPAILSVVKGKGMNVFAYSENEEKANTPTTVEYGHSYSQLGAIHYAANLSKTDTLNLITFDLLDNGSECNGIKYPQHTRILDSLKKVNHPFYANAPKSEEDEFNIPIFDTPLYDIKFKEGKASLKDRVLRCRKVTLDGGASLPQQNFENRPSYIFVLEGNIAVKKETEKEELLKPLDAFKLINTGNVEIGNASDTEKSVYLIMEIWDPADETIL